MKFVDLTHPISNEMPTYPSDPDVSIVRKKEIEIDRTLLHSFKLGTHTGTHLDVPAHIIPNGKTLDMPEYFDKIIAAELKTAMFPILEEWIDIGDFDDYKRANSIYGNHID